MNKNGNKSYFGKKSIREIIDRIISNPIRLFFIISFFQVLLILFWGVLKSNYHWDEYYSMEYAHYYSESTPPNMYLWESERFKVNEWVSIDSYEDLFVVTRENSLLNDDFSYSLKRFATKKPYFALLNIVETLLFPGVMTKWAGIFLNIPFIIIGQLFLFKLVYELSNDTKKSGLVVLIYGFCGSTIGFAEYVRFYCFLHMLLIIAMYLHYKMWTSSRLIKNLVYEILALICIYFGLLNSELVVVWGGSLIFAFSLFLLIKKRFLQFIYYSIPILGGGIGYLYFKTDFIDMLLHGSNYISGDGRPVDLIMRNLQDMSLRHLLKGVYEYMNTVGTYIFGSIIIFISIIAFLLILVIKNIKKDNSVKTFFRYIISINSFYHIMTLVVVIYSIFTIVCNIWSARYFSLMYPELIVVLVFSASALGSRIDKEKAINVILLAFILVSIFITNIFVRIENIYIEDRDDIERIQSSGNIDSLVWTDSNYYQVLMECVNWMDEDTSVYVLDDEEIIPYDNMPDTFMIWRHKYSPLSDDDMSSIKQSGYKVVDCIGETYISYVYYCEK